MKRTAAVASLDDGKEEKKARIVEPANPFEIRSPIVDFSSEDYATPFADLTITTSPGPFGEVVKLHYSRIDIARCTAKVLVTSLLGETKEPRTEMTITASKEAVNALLTWMHPLHVLREKRSEWLDQLAAFKLSTFESTEREVKTDGKTFYEFVDTSAQLLLMELGRLAHRYDDPALLEGCTSRLMRLGTPTPALVEYFRETKKEWDPNVFTHLFQTGSKTYLLPEEFALKIARSISSDEIDTFLLRLSLALPNISPGKLPETVIRAAYCALFRLTGAALEHASKYLASPSNENEKHNIREITHYGLCALVHTASRRRSYQMFGISVHQSPPAARVVARN